MKKAHVFMRLWIVALLSAVSGMGMLPAQAAPTAQTDPTANVLTAETKMFLAEWQPLRQKGLSTLEAEAAFVTLQQQYGLRIVTDGQTKAETLMLPVWVTFSSAEAMAPALKAAEALGFKVQTKLKTICTGLIPVEQVEALAAVPGVRQVQAGQRVTLQTDRARKATRVDTLQESSVLELPDVPSLRGEGTVIGVVDGGIEYVHPNFYDPDDSTVLRVQRVWSQRETRGTPPEGYNYGVEFRTPETIVEAAYSKDNETHGTHVAGIASGSGAGLDYKGMASKADLVVVPTTLVTEDILDGVNYIRAYAKEVGKPCVVNLSIGFQVGPHDGTSAFDRALDEMKEPGFVVVGAAGNDGDTPLYVEHTFNASAGDTLFYTKVEFLSTTQGNSIDMWTDDLNGFLVAVVLIDAETGDVVDRTDFYSARGGSVRKDTLFFGEQGKTKLWFSPEYSDVNKKRRMLVRVDVSQMFRPANTYAVALAIKARNAEAPSKVQMWASNGSFSTFEHDELKPAVGGRRDHLVGEIGGTSNSILSVGSYTTRNGWTDLTGKETSHAVVLPLDTLSYFSSIGPTADGRLKPEITAPGAFLVSSYNSRYPYGSSYHVAMVGRGSRDYPFGTMMGTSMAAPVVTGIVALCLQVRPDWQVDSLRLYLAHTALNDRMTGDTRMQPNNSWGYGKMDALALLTAALHGLTDLPVEEVREAVEGKRLLVYPNPNDGHFHVLLPDWGQEVRLQVVDRGGRVVYEREAQATGSPVEMMVPGLESGLYILRAVGAAGKVAADGMATKLIIR